MIYDNSCTCIIFSIFICKITTFQNWVQKCNVRTSSFFSMVFYCSDVLCLNIDKFITDLSSTERPRTIGSLHVEAEAPLSGLVLRRQCTESIGK